MPRMRATVVDPDDDGAMRGAAQLAARAIKRTIWRHDEESWKVPELHELWIMAGGMRWAYSRSAPMDAEELWAVMDRAMELGFASEADGERLRAAGW